MEDVTESEEKVLEKFYKKLYNEMKRDEKLERESVFISFIRPMKKTKYDLLERSTISKDHIENYILDSLCDKGYITETDQANQYAITGKGVWKIEKDRNKVTDSKLVDHFDTEFFDQFDYSNNPLDYKRKTLLLALIAGRPFSEEVCVDLKDKDSVGKWKEVIEDSFNLLQDLGIIGDKDLDELYGSGNLPPVAGLFQRGELNKKTKKIFKSKSNGKYYLDVSKEGEIEEDKLEFLFKKVVGEVELDLEQLERLNQFCSDISNNEAIYLYESGSTRFSTPQYDEVLWNVIMSL